MVQRTLRLRHATSHAKHALLDLDGMSLREVASHLPLEASSGEYNSWVEGDYWGYVRTQDLPLAIFHNGKLYDLSDPSFTIDMKNMNEGEASFTLNKDGRPVERIRYPREVPDTWFDEEDWDVFRTIKTFKGRLA